jgi:hypothetical protein
LGAEELHAERTHALGEIAQLRGSSLSALMKQLDIDQAYRMSMSSFLSF